MNKLKKLFETQFSYDMSYDYEDMKLAIVCSTFADDYTGYENYLEFEDIVKLATWIRIKWNEEFDNLSTEEQGYIQSYARRLLYDNADDIFDIMEKDYE